MNQFSETYHEQLNEAEKLIQLHEEESNSKDQFSKLTKIEIIELAETLIQTADIKAAYSNLLELKEAFEKISVAEKPIQIKEWIDAGNEMKDFVPPQDELKSKLLDIFNRFRDLREDERKKAEEEKLANYRKKLAILDKISSLVESEETENSLKELRELMKEWKDIRSIPKEHQEELSTKYKYFVDKFYDNLSIFNELKDLDREKNIELKIELIKKVESLKEEKNIRKSLVSLNKYHEDWKNTGPVRKEISEEIWSRFKAASDIVLENVKQQKSILDEKRKHNLEKKQLLIEKAEAEIAVLPSSIKDWQAIAKKLDNYFEDWKKIGPVPTEVNEEIWNRFQNARNTFFNERKAFFKDLNSAKTDNLKRKLELCEKAELLKSSEEFTKTSDQLQILQEDWKKIGPVPEDQNEIVWKRFREAFDFFYERRNKWFDERKKQESGSAKAKELIIEELNAISIQNPPAFQFSDLKEIQQKWNNSGFVSGKKFHTLNTKFQKLIDPLFQSLRDQNNSDREKSVRQFVGALSDSADGKGKLANEERRLRETIKKIEDEISVIENNKGFFQHSKNAESVLKQFDEKSKKLQEQIIRLKKELEIFKQAKK